MRVRKNMKKFLDFLSGREYIRGMKKPVCSCGCNTITVDNEKNSAQCSLCGKKGKILLVSRMNRVWMEIAEKQEKCSGSVLCGPWCASCSRFAKGNQPHVPEIHDSVCLDFEERE